MIKWKKIIFILVMFTTGACQRLTPILSKLGFETPTTEILADCFIDFYLYAWVDLNDNLIQDENDAFLQGVEFIVNGNYAYSAARGRGISNEAGQAIIDVWTPGECPDQIEVIAIAPDGYELISDSPVIFDEEIQFNQEIYFLFKELNNEY